MSSVIGRDAPYFGTIAMKLLLMPFLCAVATPAVADLYLIWEQYQNERFGFSIQYPRSIFNTIQQAINGDGISSNVSSPAATLAIWGTKNAMNYTSPYQNACDGGCTNETYHVSKTQMGISSGYENGDIYFTKCITDSSVSQFACFKITYRKQDKKDFEVVVTSMSNSLMWQTNATRPSVNAPPNRRSISGSSIQMKLDGGTYSVPVLINNAITLDFTVDTGATDVSIPADVVTTLMRAGTIRDTDIIGEQIYTLADGSKVKSSTFRIRSLKVGDRVLENVTGSVAPASGSLLLGQSFLRHFKSWSIDNSRHVLFLE